MEPLRADSLKEAVAALFGEENRIVAKRAVYGGDINEAYRLSLSDGSALFMKCNVPENVSFFEAEAMGLEALRQTGEIGVPQILGFGTDRAEGISFLLLEYLEAAPKDGSYWEILGRELAGMHRADCGRYAAAAEGKPFGFQTDNYIGASVQRNTPKESWVAFFRDCRLLPQMQMAERRMDARMRKQCRDLLEKLDAYLTEPAFPSLLHGDLWSGNVVCGPDGRAWILDPAVAVGHWEAELAMTELFGGFPPAFYGAYQEITPIDGGYRERRELYNLYHLLNHLNLFGGSYASSVQRILNRYC